MQSKVLGNINVAFNAAGQLLIIYFAFIRHLRRKWEYNEAVLQLFINFKKAHGSVIREVLYNNLPFGIPTKLVRLIKMCLHETYSRIQVG